MHTIEASGIMLRIINSYGSTGGQQCEEAAVITDWINGSDMDELDTPPAVATMMIGDLIAGLQDSPIVEEMLAIADGPSVERRQRFREGELQSPHVEPQPRGTLAGETTC